MLYWKLDTHSLIKQLLSSQVIIFLQFLKYVKVCFSPWKKPASLFETWNHFQIWQHVKSQQSHGYAVKQGKRRSKNDLLKFKPCLSIYSEIPILYHRWQIIYMFLQINATHSFDILLQFWIYGQNVWLQCYNIFPANCHHRWRVAWRDELRVEIWQLRWWQPRSADYLLFIDNQD